ncbi:MAG: hypothetical protein LC749_02100 [Actinobacteria bacterium]|nr:hypothetical protein [Actinomycetota bacterium]
MSSLAFTPTDGFLNFWLLYLLFVLLVLVPLAVFLLARLTVACLNIRKHGAVGVEAAAAIRENTAPVPQLAETLQLIREILDVARTVERHGGDLETVLKRPLPTGGARR